MQNTVEFSIMLCTLAAAQILDYKIGSTKVLDYTIKYEQDLGSMYKVWIIDPSGKELYYDWQLSSSDLRKELSELAHRMLVEQKVLF